MSRLAEIRKAKKETAAKISRDLDSGPRQEDKRLWKPTRDKTGTGSAVIRFLPPTGGDSLPWAKVYNHAFQGPSGKWYINNCPSTLNEESPMYEHVQALYATGSEADKKLAQQRGRKTSFYQNVLVIKDSTNPDAEGKVFIFKYGKQIHDMIATKMRPEFSDQEEVEVWDIDEGANFKLRVRTKDKYPTYESSEFDPQSALLNGDEEAIEEVLGKCYRLEEFLAPSNFKSFDQLKKELDRCLNGTTTPSAASNLSGEDDVPQSRQRTVEAVKVGGTTSTKVVAEKVAPAIPDDSGDDTNLDYFKRLLAET